MWKTTAPLLTGTCLFLAVAAVSLSAAPAGEAGKKGKDGIVRKIDLDGHSPKALKGDVSKPTKITSAEELEKVIPANAFPDKEPQDRITPQVDFTKEYLLFFDWRGSGLDKLSFEVEEGKHGPVVVFNYSQ